jgi:hypothetical protein
LKEKEEEEEEEGSVLSLPAGTWTSIIIWLFVLGLRV